MQRLRNCFAIASKMLTVLGIITVYIGCSGTGFCAAQTIESATNARAGVSNVDTLTLRCPLLDIAAHVMPARELQQMQPAAAFRPFVSQSSDSAGNYVIHVTSSNKIDTSVPQALHPVLSSGHITRLVVHWRWTRNGALVKQSSDDLTPVGSTGQWLRITPSGDIDKELRFQSEDCLDYSFTYTVRINNGREISCDTPHSRFDIMPMDNMGGMQHMAGMTM